MRALVTGSAGFVGRHMVGALETRGYEVLGVDVSDAHPDGALEIFRLGSHVFDLVVHAAARSPHRAAIDGQPATSVYNQLLDAAMFEWAIRTEQRRVLYLSSSAAYPVGFQAGHAPYRLHEDDGNPDRPVSAELLAALSQSGPLRPDGTYGWAKLTGEQMAAAARAAGVPVTVVRPFSGYGEDQSEDFPFGAFVDRARRRADPFMIWGDGTQVRDWVHIDDVVAGALAVVDSGTTDPVNLCTGVGTSMADLARMACAEAGYAPHIELHLSQPRGVAYRVGDPTRMRQYYTPQVSIKDGVKRALAGGG